MSIVFFSIQSFAQEKYQTKSGTITFESSVPSFEEVKATNNKVTAILKDDGTIASLALTKAFRFKIALMEEHFNENYLESDVYPKSTFIGKVIQNKNGDVTVKGKLTMHGITKEIIANGSLSQDNEIVTIFSEFSVKLEDYEIDIPKIVMYKIAEEIEIKVNIELKQN